FETDRAIEIILGARDLQYFIINVRRHDGRRGLRGNLGPVTGPASDLEHMAAAEGLAAKLFQVLEVALTLGFVVDPFVFPRPFRVVLNEWRFLMHDQLFNFFTSTFEWRPLWSYFSRRAGGRSSGVPSAKPPFDWK